MRLNESSLKSVAFTATSRGNKLKPLLLIPGKKLFKNFTHPYNVIVVYGTKGTFMIEKNIPSISLIIYQAPCHLTDKVKVTLVSRNIKAKLIPKRLTNFLQPT